MIRATVQILFMLILFILVGLASWFVLDLIVKTYLWLIVIAEQALIST